MKPPIVILGNKGMIKLMDNLILNLRKVGMLNKVYIIYTDEETRLHYEKKRNVILVDVNDSVNVDIPKDYANYETSLFQNITMLKYPGIKKVLEETGQDVIFMDGDIGVWREFNSYFKDVDKKDVDILCSTEVKSLYCSGFTYFKNCNDTLKFIGRHIEVAERRSKGNKYFDDQVVFNQLAHMGDNSRSKRCPAKVVPISKLQFCNGHYLQRKGQWTEDGKVENGVVRKDMYIAHANWMKGIETKISFLKRLGLYYVDVPKQNVFQRFCSSIFVKK
jgi:hypothetical protein